MSARPSTPPPRGRATSASITLRNLVAARWVLLILVALAAGFHLLAPGTLPALASWLPAGEPYLTFAILALWAAINVVSVWRLTQGRVTAAFAGVNLLIDASVLTLLLSLAGGPANPFTLLYFLPITLATQVSPRWTWALAAWCLACFASLFLTAELSGTADFALGREPAAMEQQHGSSPVEPAAQSGHDHRPVDDHSAHTHGGAQASAGPAQAQGHDAHGHFTGHMQGMWVAFGLTGVLITVFVHRIALALARQRDELTQLRQSALEDRHLAAVGTLAAGAAHELSTPLATIHLLVDELPLMEVDERTDAISTIREQVRRCKTIVSSMASPELRVTALGAGAPAWTLGRLADELVELELDAPLHLRIDDATRRAQIDQPYEVLAQLLRELLSNADEACRRSDRADADIELRLELDGHDSLRASIRDRGVGMDAETQASAFDPFFSTRPEGSGLGLGLYLARAHLRQLGGSIELESEAGIGTEVTIRVPRVGPAA